MYLARKPIWMLSLGFVVASLSSVGCSEAAPDADRAEAANVADVQPNAELGSSPEEQTAEDKKSATRTFNGTWNNKKYGTSGPLKCVATETAPGKWKATFTGTFHNDPFTYEATFQSKQVGRQLNLGGTSQIRGHDYEWTGTLKNGQLTANYKSSVGYYGQFVMKEAK